MRREQRRTSFLVVARMRLWHASTALVFFSSTTRSSSSTGTSGMAASRLSRPESGAAEGEDASTVPASGTLFLLLRLRGLGACCGAVEGTERPGIRRGTGAAAALGSATRVHSRQYMLSHAPVPANLLLAAGAAGRDDEGEERRAHLVRRWRSWWLLWCGRRCSRWAGEGLELCRCAGNDAGRERSEQWGNLVEVALMKDGELATALSVVRCLQTALCITSYALSRQTHPWPSGRATPCPPPRAGSLPALGSHGARCSSSTQKS